MKKNILAEPKSDGSTKYCTRVWYTTKVVWHSAKYSYHTALNNREHFINKKVHDKIKYKLNSKPQFKELHRKIPHTRWRCIYIIMVK